MDEEDDDSVFEEKPSAAKLSRKVGEKLRRDRLNSLITQLAEEIPIIKYAHRRLDKSAILRLTVSYLKLHLGLKRKNLGRSLNLQNGGVLNWLKKVTDDILLILTQSGTVIYVSPKIFDMLGFYQTDMVGHNIKRFVHADDLNVFMSQFCAPTDLSLKAAFSRSMWDTDSLLQDKSLTMNSGFNSFCVRMLRSTRGKQNTSDAREYETICVRANCEKNQPIENGNSSGNELWMLALLKPFKSEPVKEVEVRISEFMKNNEWATMHNLDSRIVANDHRASLFHGFMASEIVGKTPYMLINEDDLESVAISHQMIMKNHQIPSTVFRMNNKFDVTIYVQSQSIIVKDQWTKLPKCIVSVNTVLSTEEGQYLLSGQKKRTQKFIESQPKQEVKNTESVKQEVESEDSFDSVKVSSLSQGTLSREQMVEIKKSTGKGLNEIYEKHSQKFPDMYLSNECGSSSNRSFPEKRSYDSMDSDSSGMESSISASVSGSELSSSSVTEDEADSPRLKSPSLTELLTEGNGAETDRSYVKTSDQSAKQQSSSLLKGILEGNVKTKKRDDGLVYDNVRNFSKTGKGNGASSIASLPVVSGNIEGHAAAGHVAGVQSPTVDSSGVGSASPSMENPSDVNIKPSVYCRFTSQLQNKQLMLKQTIDSQKLTLEMLRDQLQRSHNNVILSPQQKQIHDSLIDKISQAENQVVVQGQLLGEIEQDIFRQQQHYSS